MTNCSCQVGAINFDPVAMAPGWSFEKWEAMKRDLSQRFPNLGRMQADIERRYSGERQAWWYWKAVVRTSAKMAKWWFYLLGTHLSDFDKIIILQAKHMRDLTRAVVETTVPEPILDGLLGLGPRIRVINETPGAVGSVDDITGAIDFAGDMASFAPIPGVGFALKAASSITRVLAKFFSGAWKISPPDRDKGELAVRVMSPVFVLEMPFGDTKETMIPTGVPSRFTRDALAAGFGAQDDFARQSEAAGALSARQAEEAARQATAQGVQAGQAVDVQKTSGGGIQLLSPISFGQPQPTPASAGFDIKSIPAWGWGLGALGLIGIGLLAVRR